jgi:hypothetical protein
MDPGIWGDEKAAFILEGAGSTQPETARVRWNNVDLLLSWNIRHRRKFAVTE